MCLFKKVKEIITTIFTVGKVNKILSNSDKIVDIGIDLYKVNFLVGLGYIREYKDATFKVAQKHSPEIARVITILTPMFLELKKEFTLVTEKVINQAEKLQERNKEQTENISNLVNDILTPTKETQETQE